MNQLRRFRKNKDVTEKKIKEAKSTTLKLALIMLNFIFATFAWFTYTIILDNKVDVNVSAWQVDFKDSDTVLGNAMQFQIGDFYPGMDDISKQLDIVNLGDRPASITYEIESLKILGQPYQIKEEGEEAEEGDVVYVYKSETVEPVYKVDEDGDYVLDLNGDKIIEKYLNVIKLLNNSSKYPFEIIITHSLEINIANPDNEEQNKGTFGIYFTWPYEITAIPEELPDDLEEGLTDEEIIQELNERKTTLDTKWGYDIANFYKAQEEGDTTQGIEITLQAIAKQII